MINLKESEARREIETADRNCILAEREYRRLKEQEKIGTSTSIQDDRNRLASNMAKTIELYIKSLITQFITIKVPPSMQTIAGTTDFSPEEQQLLLTKRISEIRNALANNPRMYPTIKRLYDAIPPQNTTLPGVQTRPNQSPSRQGQYIESILAEISSITYRVIGHDLQKGLLALKTVPTSPQSDYYVNNIAGNMGSLSQMQIWNKISPTFSEHLEAKNTPQNNNGLSDEEIEKRLQEIQEEIDGMEEHDDDDDELRALLDEQLRLEYEQYKRNEEIEKRLKSESVTELEKALEDLINTDEDAKKTFDSKIDFEVTTDNEEDVNEKDYTRIKLPPSYDAAKVSTSEVKDAFVEGRYGMVSDEVGRYYRADIETLYQLMMAFNKNMGEIWKKSLGIMLGGPENLSSLYHIWPDSGSTLIIRDFDGKKTIETLKCDQNGQVNSNVGIDIPHIYLEVGQTIEYQDGTNPAYIGGFAEEIRPIKSISDPEAISLLKRDQHKAGLEKQVAKLQEMLDQAIASIKEVPGSDDGRVEPR